MGTPPETKAVPSMLATSEEIVPFAAATAATTTAATATAATAAEKTAVVGAELAAAGVGAGSAATEEKPAKDGAGISAESVVAEGSTDLLPKEDLRRKEEEEEVNIDTEAASVKEEAVELKQEAVSLEPETVKLEPALAVGIIAEVKMEETAVTKAEDEEEQHKVELGALEVPQPEKVEVKTPRRGRCF